MCIVGEPTSLMVATGHKGKTGLRATCKGREGHSALAPLAMNALHLAADFINTLREIQVELANIGNRDNDYDVPYTTVHAGKIHGGTVVNIVPNHCEIDFEIRTIAEDDPADILAAVQSRVDALNRAVQADFPETGIVIEAVNGYPGLNTAGDADVVEFVKSLIGANGTIKVAFGTEGGLFTQKLGIPCVVCGPGSMAQGHKPDEFIEREQLTRCDTMLDNLIKRLVSGI